MQTLDSCCGLLALIISRVQHNLSLALLGLSSPLDTCTCYLYNAVHEQKQIQCNARYHALSSESQDYYYNYM